MIARVLPREEWHRLVGTPCGILAPMIPDGRGDVVVVQATDGTIIACWALLEILHAEGAWVAPEYRFTSAPAMLVEAMKQQARAHGVVCVNTAAEDPKIERLLVDKMGAEELPGKHFVMSVKE